MTALGSHIYYSSVSFTIWPPCPKFPEMPTQSGDDLIKRPLIRDGEIREIPEEQVSAASGLRGWGWGLAGGAVYTMFLLRIQWGTESCGRQHYLCSPPPAPEVTLPTLLAVHLTQATGDLAKIKLSSGSSPSVIPQPSP